MKRRAPGRFNVSKCVSGDTYNCLASTNLLTQEMLTLLGIVLFEALRGSGDGACGDGHVREGQGTAPVAMGTWRQSTAPVAMGAWRLRTARRWVGGLAVGGGPAAAA